MVTPPIRRATPDDAEAIASVHIAAWLETYAPLVPQAVLEASTRPSERAALWIERLMHAERSVFVLERDERLVGFACAAPTGCPPVRLPLIDGYDAYLEALYLLREVHGHGLGRDIVRALVDDVRLRGATSLSLHVLATNPSRAFYEKYGALFIRDEPVAPPATAPQCAYAWPDLGALAARLA